MESLLQEIAHYVALAVEAMAIVVVGFGSFQALIDVFRIMLQRKASAFMERAVWLRYARWLVAGLTFQLAADIVGTSFSPTWDQVGRLAAVAAIRSLLSYFLDHEAEHTRNLQHVSETREATSKSL
jgi:uncharacterized membrane protein